MFKKKNRKKNSRAMLSAYSIIMILIIALGILSHLLPKAQYAALVPEEEVPSVEVGPGEWEGEAPAEDTEETTSEETMVEETTSEEGAEPAEASTEEVVTEESTEVPTEESTVEAISVEGQTEGNVVENVTADQKVYDSLEACEAENEACAIVDGSGVEGAQLYQILMAPILGFEDAIDVCIFIMMLGGFLAVVARTKALENGIKLLVKKLHGKEYLLIVLLMFIFSVMGTTYGFLEESVGFYILIAATMFAAGLDPLVGVATILLSLCKEGATRQRLNFLEFA